MPIVLMLTKDDLLESGAKNNQNEVIAESDKVTKAEF